MIFCNFKHLIGKKIIKISDNDYRFNFISTFLKLETYSENFLLSFNNFQTKDIDCNPMQLLGIIGKIIRDVFIVEKENELDLHIITDQECILNIKKTNKINIYIE